MIGLLLGLGAPLLGHVAIIALDFLLAWAASRPAPADARTGPWPALRAFLRECLDSIVVFQIAQPWLANRPLPGEHGEPGRGIPVLLIHGYGCNRQMWRPMAGWLAAAGHPIAAVDLDRPWADIDSHDATVGAAVAQLRKRAGGKPVAIIGHSMGGLVARTFLGRHGGEGIAMLITLGSPHHGTVHARFGHGEAARQMRPDSDWLQRLADTETRQRAAIRATPDRLVLFSLQDNIVAPRQRQRLPHARNIAFVGLGHLTLCRDRAVFEAIAQALSEIAGTPRNADPAAARAAAHPVDRPG